MSNCKANQKNLDAAFQFRDDLRLSVIPIGRNKNATVSWKEYQHRLATDDELEHWFGVQKFNIGIVTGQLSDVFVLDIDFKDGGYETLQSLETKFGILPPTWIAKTSGGGEHRYFQFPKNAEIRNSKGRLGETKTNKNHSGIDIRGEGGYVVAPPSIHANGNPYEWALPPWKEEIAEAPQWLLNEIAKISSSDSSSSSQKGPCKPSIFGRADDGRELIMSNTVWWALHQLARKNGQDCKPEDEEVLEIAWPRYLSQVKERDGRTLEEDNRGATEMHRKIKNKLKCWSQVIANVTRETEELERRRQAIANGEIPPPEGSDDSLADIFASKNITRFRYYGETSFWFSYQNNKWERDINRSVEHEIRCSNRIESANQEARKGIASASRMNSVKRLAETDPRLTAPKDGFDADPMLLNTPDGIIDLKTGEIKPNSWTDYCSKATAVPLGSGVPKLFLQFLEKTFGSDQQLIAYVQRILGYALTGLTSEQALFFFYGSGANGKSVLLSTVSGILGDYASKAPLDTFTQTNRQEHPTELARLIGARLVVSEETNVGGKWDEARIKSLTGSDTVTARLMRQDYFEYRPQFKLIFAGNHPPAITSTDQAMRRRIQIVPFKETIPAAERDPFLAEKLSDEWPQILNWMVEGCARWQSERLNPPEAIIRATGKYFDEEDIFGRWVDERCIEKSSAQTPSRKLYQNYRDYVQDCGANPIAETAFAREMEARGFTRARTAKCNVWCGINLLRAAA